MTPTAGPHPAAGRTRGIQVVAAIIRANLTRLSRDRLGLFFILLLPFLIILLFGVAAADGPASPAVGLLAHDDAAVATALVDRLQDAEELEVVRYGDRAQLERALRRGRLQAAVVLPHGLDAALRADETVDVELLADPSGGLPAVARSVIDRIVAEESARIEAGRIAAATSGLGADEARAMAAAVDRAGEPEVVVETVTAVADDYDPLSHSAAGNLVLFVFITSLVGSSALVETRRLGLSRRMLAAPTSARTVLLGEASARFAVALFQGVLVVVGASVLFGVDWQDPLAVALIVVLISLAGTGAAMLMGARFRNAEQAATVAVPMGIGLGMLGGCLWPLEIVPAPLQAIGRLTPHAWAMDGLTAVTMRGAGVPDVLGAVTVLGVYGAALLAVAAWQLRRALLS